MKKLDIYILRQMALATFFLTAGLTFAVWLTQSLRFVNYIVNRGLPIVDFFMLVGLMIPSFLTVVLPVSLFIATLFVYNKMASDSELVVFSAAGVGLLRIGRPAVTLALIATIFCYALSLYLLPASYRGFKEWQFKIRNDYSSILIQEGVFSEVLPNVTLFVRERADEGELRGLLIHDRRVPAKPVTVMAEQGALVIAETGPRLLLVDGNRQEVERGTGELSLLYFDRYTMELGDPEGPEGGRWRNERERFLHELFDPKEPAVRRSFGDSFRAEGHQRLVAPLFPICFVLIALAALLSGQTSRRGQARRLIVAGALAALVQTAGIGLQNLAAKAPSVIPLMYVNTLLPIALALAILMFGPPKIPFRDRPGPGPKPARQPQHAAGGD